MFKLFRSAVSTSAVVASIAAAMSFGAVALTPASALAATYYSPACGWSTTPSGNREYGCSCNPGDSINTSGTVCTHAFKTVSSKEAVDLNKVRTTGGVAKTDSKAAPNAVVAGPNGETCTDPRNKNPKGGCAIPR